MADSYIQDSSRTPGAVAELAATRKEVKYSMLAGTHIFQPLAFESHGPQNASDFFYQGSWSQNFTAVRRCSRDPVPLSMAQVILQRFNAVLFGESFLAAADDPDM